MSGQLTTERTLCSKQYTQIPKEMFILNFCYLGWTLQTVIFQACQKVHCWYYKGISSQDCCGARHTLIWTESMALSAGMRHVFKASSWLPADWPSRLFGTGRQPAPISWLPAAHLHPEQQGRCGDRHSSISLTLFSLPLWQLWFCYQDSIHKPHTHYGFPPLPLNIYAPNH